jgi:hypothetical protein
MEKNYVKKELMKSKEMASFSHYTAGNLYYRVKVGMDVYQFPIPTVEEGPTFNEDESGLSMYEVETVVLSSDLGTTDFSREMRGSHLNRWIGKAIDSGEFIMIEPAVAPV